MRAADGLRLAVFDCDGTLVDSQHTIIAAMTAAWQAAGLGNPDADAVRRVVGLRLEEAIARLLPPGSGLDPLKIADHYIAGFRDIRASQGFHEPLYPGALQAIEAAEASGTLLGIATGKGRRGLVATLERHGLIDKFVILKTADDGPGKPDPTILLDAMKECGACAERTAMIGDTTYDMAMAVSAGTGAIGVSWGYHSREDLETTGAHRIIDQYEDLAAALDARWNHPVGDER